MNWVLIISCFVATLAVAYAKTCSSAEDCNEGECCTALSILTLQRRGVCLKLTKSGKRCSEPESALDYYGGKYILHCPCQEGFTCEPKGAKGGRTAKTELSRYLDSLRCQVQTSTAQPETTIPEEITEPTEVEDETGNEGTEDEGTGDEETGDEGTGDEETGEEGTGDEGTGEEETGEEVTGEEETGDEETGDVETEDEGTGDEGTGNEDTEDEGTGEEETGDEGTAEEEIGDEETGEEETGDEETGDEETGEEETGDEETGEEETGDETPVEIGEGPGGEPPRDDDCLDWEYPC